LTKPLDFGDTVHFGEGRGYIRAFAALDLELALTEPVNPEEYFCQTILHDV
jgi:hypothetical protein